MDWTVVRALFAKPSYPWLEEETQDSRPPLLNHCIAIASRCNLQHPTTVQQTTGIEGTKEGRRRHRPNHTRAIRHACERKASPTTEMRVYTSPASASFVLFPLQGRQSLATPAR
mmetsp:Transcript_1062/g.6769  ORF Transcript_1062/g.6769 Transcript_1062/m.6769 type:complete len:114 (-) Transcript_1062:1081-1422(-)